MSITVYIGHTGQRLNLDPSVTSTLDALRSWIASNVSTQSRNQILLTSQGKQVRTQTLLTETELFVFDSSWLNGTNATSSAKKVGVTEEDGVFEPGEAPHTIANQTDLQAWETLFAERKTWATNLLDGCSEGAKKADRYQDEQAVIERSLGVAVASLQQHIKTAEKQYGSSESWANEILQEQQAHTDHWESHLSGLSKCSARPEFARFLQPIKLDSASKRHSQHGGTSTLQGFVDVNLVRETAHTAKSHLDDLTGKMAGMRERLDSATRSSDQLLQAVDQLNNRSATSNGSEQPAQLVEEIGMVVKKMASDLEHVQSLPRAPPSVSQASKMALLHTKNYLPALNEYCGEINEVMHKNCHQRNIAADAALEHMRTLSTIESQLAKLFQNMKELDVPEDQQKVYATLNIITRLPSVYGQLLVESVRRREWVAKMKRDSTTLQEEVATYQEEEDKRRKKWMRTVDDIVDADAMQSRVLGIELNLQNEGGSWPMVTRDELDEYLRTLHEVYGQGPVVDEIEQAIKDLDKPTRKQIKHAKAFKNGSMHEAAFGDTSLLLRGDEQHKGLRETNARLEEDIRAQKSRVRKLEDMVYRQSQTNRISFGDAFTPQSDSSFQNRRPISPGTLSSQLADDLSRTNSLSKHRRPSVVQAPSSEEKRLAKRVVDLETELQTYKSQADHRKNSDAAIQKQVDDAISIKKDLMENMEAQQREFVSERRALERELAEAREKIEETENEIERLIGSREGADDEMVRLKEDAAGHAARAAAEQDARGNVERKLQQAEATQARAEEQLQQLRDAQEQGREADAETLQVLATAHTHLLPNAELPTGLISLAAALEQLARRSGAHAKDLEEAVAFAKSENESLWSSNERQKVELTAASQQQAGLEEQIRQQEEKVATSEAKAVALADRLSDEQKQLQMLQNKFADGETGSEVLRQRLADEEAKATKLAHELATEKSHVNSLDVELLRLQKKHKAYENIAQVSEERLGKRAERAKELSQRLYSHNARLGRLLERLGLIATYQDDAMVIERASKMNASIVDANQLQRTVSLTSPPPTRKSSSAEPEPPTDLRSLHWPNAQTLEDEAVRFETFSKLISRFDLDVFSEAVTKRVKDFEYTAKKYSKEAKEATKRADAYKERAIKLRTEAHAKIAVRDFKEGDMALFLPTRGGQVKGAWAAFNIGCPHYFLAEREGMRLGTRDFIVARIQRVEQKVVDLSGQRNAAATAQISAAADGRSIDETSDAISSMHVEDDNPFDLSDGLTWWMVHATEERGAGGAPTTPGLGKSTVAAANVDAKGSIRIKRSSKSDDASKHLNKSLDSRRSSSGSKKGGVATIAPAGGSPALSPNALEPPRPRSTSQASSLKPLPAPATSGLGIIADQQDSDEKDNEPPRRDEIPLPGVPTRSGSKPRQRSQSPSKSVRSLQRHLDPVSPVKPTAAKKAGWESLWSTEFSVESPTKGDRK